MQRIQEVHTTFALVPTVLYQELGNIIPAGFYICLWLDWWTKGIKKKMHKWLQAEDRN